LRHAVDAPDAESGLRLATALWRFWYQRGYLRQGAAWLTELLGLEPDSVSPARANAFLALGGLTFWLSDADATEVAYASALRIFEELGDREAEAEARYDMAFVAVMRDDLHAALGWFRESLALASDVGRADLVAKNQHALGVGLRETGDIAAGLALIEQALAFFRRGDDRHQLVWALGEMALSLHMLGKRQAAWISALEALDLVAEARNLPGICAAIELISMFESVEDRHADAVRLRGAAAALREEIGATTPRMLSQGVDVEGLARAALGETATAQALADGRRMTSEQAIEYARTLAYARIETADARKAQGIVS
jgi:tetratricopeptide (TPR) repeat protein